MPREKTKLPRRQLKGGYLVLQRNLGLVSLTRDQWLTCIGFAIVLLLVEEVIKFFMRRRQPAAPAKQAAALKPVPNA